MGRVIAGPFRKASHAFPIAFVPDEAPELRVCSLTIDDDWRITRISPEAATWFGVDPTAVVGADARQCLPIPQPLYEASQSSMTEGAIWHAKVRSVIHPEAWIEIRVFPSDGGVGVLFWETTGDHSGQNSDDSLIESPLIANSEEMALLDARGFVISVNAAWRAATMGLKSRWVGALYSEACHEAFPDLDAAVLQQAVSQLANIEIQAFTHAYTVFTANGQLPRQVRMIPVRTAGAARLVAIHEDIDVVERTNSALRKTTKQLLSAQEDERERIAMELHDSTGQHLVAVGLGIARLQQILRPRDDIERALGEMAASLQEAHHEIRTFSYLLRPPSLHQGGLSATVRRFVKGFGSRSGLHSTFKAEGIIGPATADIEHATIRVIQEALANVHRHADATSVDVELSQRNGLLSMRVTDDGRGIEALKYGDLNDIAHGVGIAGMRARVEQLGGTFEIHRECVGTSVVASIPAD